MSAQAAPRRGFAVSALLLSIGAGSCATAPAPRGAPLFDRVEVRALVVESVPLPGTEPERQWFAALATEQATASARRLALERGLAEVIELEAERSTPILSGRVSLPTALPPEYRGSRAAFVDGQLASALLQLHDDRGRLLASAEAAVDWDDVRWTTGGPKLRRARRTDAALLDAAELAIERALRRLLVEVVPEPRP
jgi:hypothetical protein